MPGENREAEAAELLKGRAYDRDYTYHTNRDMAAYVHSLKGMAHFLEFVRKNQASLGSKTLLDIGAGKLVAASQLKRCEWADGLDIEATSLTYDTESAKRFGAGLHITNAETLRGIKSNSIAAAISVIGIAYSASPEKVVKSLDRVLVPSGVLKAVFNAEHKFGFRNMQPEPPDEFIKYLREAGWRVSAFKAKRESIKIVLAEKPPFLVDPLKLLIQDRRDYKDQFDQALRNFPPA